MKPHSDDDTVKEALGGLRRASTDTWNDIRSSLFDLVEALREAQKDPSEFNVVRVERELERAEKLLEGYRKDQGRPRV